MVQGGPALLSVPSVRLFLRRPQDRWAQGSRVAPHRPGLHGLPCPRARPALPADPEVPVDPNLPCRLSVLVGPVVRFGPEQIESEQHARVQPFCFAVRRCGKLITPKEWSPQLQRFVEFIETQNQLF